MIFFASGSIGFFGANENDGVGVESGLTVNNSLGAGGITFAADDAFGFVFVDFGGFGHQARNGAKRFTTEI